MNLFKRIKLTKLLENKNLKFTEQYQGSRVYTFTFMTDDKEFMRLLRELLGSQLKYEDKHYGKRKTGTSNR